MARVPPEETTLKLEPRATVFVVAFLALAGCGESKDYANDPRPATRIDVSASILPDRVTVSPRSFGAGPVSITIANLTQQTHELTVETGEEGASNPRLRQTTSPINPEGTAMLRLDLVKGHYTVGVGEGDVRDARMTVGRKRPSSQDQLLQP
ncbi:MAG: hypothetical protein ACR2NB_14175 [Solirubrobacteraceae bacterium]